MVAQWNQIGPEMFGLRTVAMFSIRSKILVRIKNILFNDKICADSTLNTNQQEIKQFHIFDFSPIIMRRTKFRMVVENRMEFQISSVIHSILCFFLLLLL